MNQPTVCRTCRFWSLLRDGALIGHCRKAESRKQFPRGVDSCGQWEAVRRQETPEKPTSRPEPDKGKWPPLR